MSIFGRIRDAIFGKRASAQPAPATAGPLPTAIQAPPPAAPPPPMDMVDVEAILDRMAADKGVKLNWRTSIVDLMKLLGMDASLAERKELAQELGYAGELNGSAEMNIFLHKAVMKKLAENGGMVPASLLS
jgi:hypothetical protein